MDEQQKPQEGAANPAGPGPESSPAAASTPAPAPSHGPRGGGRGGYGGGRGGGGPRGRRRPDGRHGGPGSDGPGDDLVEKVVFINRSSKVVKGGRRFNFSALIVVGDKKGRVGVGLGKSNEVADAIRKGGESARAQLVNVNLKDTTIPHEVFSRYCGAKVLLRPASPGTGIIAGKTVRAVLESAGVKNVLSKSLGSKNAANVVKATLNALLSLRQREEIFRSRGIEVKPVEAAAPVAVA